MARVWGIIRVRDKIASDLVIELQAADLDEALETLCLKLDIPRPVVLKKHYNEFAKFFRTRFLPGDFIEHVRFDSFEAEVLRDRKRKDAAGAASHDYD